LGIVLGDLGHLGLDADELLFEGGDGLAAFGFEVGAFVACLIGHDEDVDEVIDVDDADVALGGGDGFGADGGLGPDGSGDDKGGEKNGDRDCTVVCHAVAPFWRFWVFGGLRGSVRMSGQWVRPGLPLISCMKCVFGRKCYA